MKHRRSGVLAGALTVVCAGTALAWGAHGHGIIGRVAAAGLPADMPSFFTGAVDQLAYLNPEPDRWRDNELSVMNEAWRYDHYIDLENVPEGGLDAPDRFEYLEGLYAAGLEEPQQNAGFLPYRIMELYQRLATGFARWRRVEDDRERAWIEQRIINDAGILGHYVADASNPHHTTIHFNGWNSAAPNPEGYTTSRDFHYQFESQFVEATTVYDDVAATVAAGAEPVTDPWATIRSYIVETNARVVPLYELEKAFGFDPGAPAPETEAFVVERLSAGAAMLRALWYSAWVDSEAIADAWDD